MSKIVTRSRDIVKQLTSGVQHLMKKNGVTVYQGHGRIAKVGDIKTIIINNDTEILAKHLIIATGARNRAPASIVVDGNMVWDCRHAMTAESAPKSLVVIGAGVIGMEFASFFNALGAKVTVIEYMDKILGYADDDVIKYATNAFKKAGIEFILGAAVESVDSVAAGVSVKIKGNNVPVNADRCLVATGIQPNTDDIGLENAPGILTDRGHIVTGSGCATGEPGVYAIGDVAMGPWLAHKAMQEGIRCVEGIMGLPITDLSPDSVPSCVYSMPQIAQIGLTESQARATDKEISVATYPLKANGKALTENNDGFVKVIFEKNTGIFLGAHMVGAHVTELIHGYSLLHTLEGLADDVCKAVFPHPTLSEAVQEAVMSATGNGLHF